MAITSELPIDIDASAMDMANAMFGAGISVLDASYQGAEHASGIYSQGDSVAPGVIPADSGVILSTGRATDITNSSGDANISSGTSTSNFTPGDADLSAISGQSTFDAAIFEAEFVPDGSTLTMQVVFSSEEYLEYVNSSFNDAVGIWVNGEAAQLAVGSGDITINNINDESNSNLYIDNPASGEVYNTEMDGLTVTLTLKAPVTPGVSNTIRIGIADGGDDAFDSNLLIAGHSVQTALVAGDDEIEAHLGQEVEADLLANDESAAGGTLTITAINNQPVGVGDTVVLATGEAITLTPTGMILAASTEAPGESTFSYEVSDEAGNTDIGFVTLTTTPCFVAGTLIETPSGAVPVEALRPGDMVMTRDHGAQPLGWLGISTRRAEGPDAPVRIAAGALGDHAALDLSPNHRVMITSPTADLLFAEREVLVRALDLAGQAGIARCEDARALRYVHLLFDRHEIVCGNGLWSESYHPGPETMNGFDVEAEVELRRLFPELYEGMGPARYGPAARRALRRFEAGLLVATLPPGGRVVQGALAGVRERAMR